MSRMFGTDGVRGIANTELTAELAYSLGRAGAFVLTEGTHKPKILVAKDTRISGDMLESALIAAKKRKINRHLGDSVFECIMMGSTKDVQEHVQYAAMESVDTMSIMDAAFMETVLKYTVLETVQTMGLYNFDHSDIKKICNHYMK